MEALTAVLAAFDAYHVLGPACEERCGAWLVREPRAPHVYDANHVRRITTPDADVPELLDEAERQFGDLPFRSFRLDPRSAGRRLEARLALAGFAASAELLMVLEGPLRGRAAELPLSPLDGDADWAAWQALKHQDARTPWFPAIADEWRAYVQRKGPAVRYVGAWDGGALVGFLSHFVHDGVGYLEDLLVAPAARLRGVATALLADAARAAQRRGARIVFVPAAADDTPKQMYARMGFAPVGTSWSWLRLRDATGRTPC